MYRGKKFNTRKEDVQGEDYLGIRKYRFYLKCITCSNEIAFKTDPENSDYVLELGATRNFEVWHDAKTREDEAAKSRADADAGDAMTALENRTLDSKLEIDVLDALDEIKAYNQRHESAARGTGALLAAHADEDARAAERAVGDAAPAEALAAFREQQQLARQRAAAFARAGGGAAAAPARPPTVAAATLAQLPSSSDEDERGGGVRRRGARGRGGRRERVRPPPPPPRRPRRRRRRPRRAAPTQRATCARRCTTRCSCVACVWKRRRALRPRPSSSRKRRSDPPPPPPTTSRTAGPKSPSCAAPLRPRHPRARSAA